MAFDLLLLFLLVFVLLALAGLWLLYSELEYLRDWPDDDEDGDG